MGLIVEPTSSSYSVPFPVSWLATMSQNPAVPASFWRADFYHKVPEKKEDRERDRDREAERGLLLWPSSPSQDKEHVLSEGLTVRVSIASLLPRGPRTPSDC